MAALSRWLLVRCALATLSAAAWAGAVWRLADGAGGPVEATVAVGGWGLGLLPVHAAMGAREPVGREVRRYGPNRPAGPDRASRQGEAASGRGPGWQRGQ
ncbi:MAG: hypothetical protein ACRDP3_02505 [Streptomyces sp.]|uniref:hypothetical protein n=1 Tax=Streptomyces sp. TaxID=1931 RepID=UPI003D6A7058